MSLHTLSTTSRLGLGGNMGIEKKEKTMDIIKDAKEVKTTAV